MFPARVRQEDVQGRAADADAAVRIASVTCRNLGNDPQDPNRVAGRIERRPMHGHGASHQWLRQHRSPDRRPYLECLVRSYRERGCFQFLSRSEGRPTGLRYRPGSFVSSSIVTRSTKSPSILVMPQAMCPLVPAIRDGTPGKVKPERLAPG